MTVPMARILVVDDDESVASCLFDLIRTATPHVVECTTSPTDAVVRHKHQPFDLVISDVRMPMMNGLMLVQQLRAIAPETRIVLFSAHYSADVARGAGAFAFLDKPVRSENLLAVIERALTETGEKA